jgi:site-specific DNA-methyltransferase (adenine-specific)
MAGMADKPDGYFDLAIVDPPYGIGEDGSRGNPASAKWKNPKPTKHIVKKWDKTPPTKEYFDELFRVSKNQIIWGANYYPQFLKSSMGWIYWDKETGDSDYSDGELAFTSFNRALKRFNWMWNGFRQKQPENRIHPTQKPVALYDWILQNYATEGQNILDTHVGSGSSRIAAYKGGFNFTGFEIDPEYHALQEARFREFVMNTAPADLEPVTRHGQIKLF